MMLRGTLRQSRLTRTTHLPIVRLFSSSPLKFQEIPKSKPQEEPKSDGEPKRRPLSRVAIGGSKDSLKQFNKGSGLEFATWKAVVILLVFGGIGTYFFQKEKARLQHHREMEQNRKVGTPLIGGPFNLVDTNGNSFTEKNLVDPKGKKFSILYFGFTHCPDVCPEELDKLGDMLEILKKNNVEIQPIFITCDPNRDTPKVVDAYLKDFHPDIIGLTGEYEEVKNACKKYRVYFSTPPDVKPGQDYLVDHSIFFYVLDPEGNFVDVIGREALAPESALKITELSEAYIPKSEREAKQNGLLGFLYK
ncbi:Sco1 copper transporter [Candida orthopsilosis Co 90-125]|uniref:Sco1 copper transporter n=1 Tax=Candida orthopsilosis (strain 90-125) TaxID=1136231 RepID=H8XAI4_CANO9|nr:Sco1 copper transporter [Candida orthopsilosis Co 90-125]CCG24833.1 Sco1 copper transporter [Candida orthopsilosis Co 90-125]